MIKLLILICILIIYSNYVTNDIKNNVTEDIKGINEIKNTYKQIDMKKMDDIIYVCEIKRVLFNNLEINKPIYQNI